ncbi:MAG: Rieske 2Fe-2S domain-containing protein [Burkholderiaceae bacterium]|nr:Rieske 2Fe-2S domain-containing protein [Burkholderiaceae bacterium]MDO9089755.1 Rieske 2Fe-2S domain-containing protein [Burkholderiaceae bacterium]MDP1967998.1 Rieske 2Fe-2S domain-containing protein [Burkholderiaceae bacterium]
MSEQIIPLCNATDLVDGGLAVSFDVVHGGYTCRAFAIRYQGQARAYLNRCAHIAMEMDYQPNRFFDDSGRWLICATHGAVYEPDTGVCAGGPCRGGGLIPVTLSEAHGVVHWHTAWNLQPVEF